MRTVRFMCACVVSSLFLGGGALAQSLGDVGGPAENPPAAYAGKQYVDSNGCVFVRAGFDGNVTWVPRVSRDRKHICGFTPTFVSASETPSKPTTEVVAAAPLTSAAPKVKPVVAPVAVVATAPIPASAPAKTTARLAPPIIAPIPDSALPRGFKKAWSDGRLNPNRGPRTQTGDSGMAMIWTNTTPSRLLADENAYPKAVPVLNQGSSDSGGSPQSSSERASSLMDSVRVSSKSSPQASSSPQQYVQVAIFGDDGNSKATISKLQRLGLPVSTSKLKSRGQDYIVVLAGPFTQSTQANKALKHAQGAGFSDAFLRD